MWPRLTFDDFRVIGHYLGNLIVFTGAVMAIPLLVALACGDGEIATNYLLSIGVSLFAGFLLCMLKVNPTNLKRKQAVVITALAWMACSLIAALPLYLSGHFLSYFDSLFEAMSGFTTSGFSLCIDIDHLSLADNAWRFIMHFIGGQGIVVIILTIGTFIASWMGTTGAAMLLIRPLLRANAHRKYRVHQVVFFIFLVANIGGSLSPLGDPPLFLGFLKGVSFFWTTTHVFLLTVIASVILLALYFVIDTVLYKKEGSPVPPASSKSDEKLGFEGRGEGISAYAVCIVKQIDLLEQN